VIALRAVAVRRQVEAHMNFQETHKVWLPFCLASCQFRFSAKGVVSP
jgi:hypothetical protein